jgi:hypothetical protein
MSFEFELSSVGGGVLTGSLGFDMSDVTWGGRLGVLLPGFELLAILGVETASLGLELSGAGAILNAFTRMADDILNEFQYVPNMSPDI